MLLRWQSSELLCGRAPAALTSATLPSPVEPKAFAMPGDHRLRFRDAKRGSPVRPNTRQPDPEEPIGDRQPQPLFLVPALEDKKLMAQGKQFCLECNSRTERITEENEHGNQDRGHRQEAYRCPALSAIGTARIEFLVGTPLFTTRTGLISGLRRILLMVEWRRQRLQVVTTLFLCRDSVGCITATQSRPNNFQLQTSLVCRQGWRRSTLGSWRFISPTRLQNAQTGRRPRYARPPLPKNSASRVENWAAFSFDEPQPLAMDGM